MMGLTKVQGLWSSYKDLDTTFKASDRPTTAIACITVACTGPSSALSHSSLSPPASVDSTVTFVGSLQTMSLVVSDSNNDRKGVQVENVGVTRGAYVGGQVQNWTQRRGVISAAVLAMLSALCSNCPSSHAFSLGISGPKEWLKGQKQKTAKFLFAPIYASRDRLDSALLLLSATDGSSFVDYEEAARLVKVAARDCMPAQPGSITEFQTRTGVEVCTFRLVLKNAASLLDNNDPLKVNADAALDELISSFVVLDRLLADRAVGSTSRREKVMGAFKETTLALDSFERGVRNCLGIA